jgi:hypothetical protein
MPVRFWPKIQEMLYEGLGLKKNEPCRVYPYRIYEVSNYHIRFLFVSWVPPWLVQILVDVQP